MSLLWSAKHLTRLHFLNPSSRSCHAMGFKRNMGQAGLCLALLAEAAGVRATSAPEPLIVTRLSDPEARLITQGVSNTDPALGDTMASFAQAISQSALADVEAAQSRCNSRAAIPAAGAARMSWEANCSYRRH
jgi:hypothetical protein